MVKLFYQSKTKEKRLFDMQALAKFESVCFGHLSFVAKKPLVCGLIQRERKSPRHIFSFKQIFFYIESALFVDSIPMVSDHCMRIKQDSRGFNKTAFAMESALLMDMLTLP